MDADQVEFVLSTVRRFVREAVVAREDEIEALDAIPDDLRRQAADLGLFGYALPEAHGGLGMTVAEEVLISRELGYTAPSFRSLFSTNNGIAGQVIVAAGSDAQRAEYLPRMASGECIASFALTEPEAGSDAASLQTTAVREEGGFVLNGTKRFITNSPLAGLFVVFARTGGAGPSGISVFVVEADTPGITIGDRDKKMGQAGSWTADVIFDDVRVPDKALLGAEGAGFKLAMDSLNRGRLNIASACVGLAERLIEESATFALRRHQFGRPVGSFQLVQAMLADSRVEAYAGQAMVDDAASSFETSSQTPWRSSACKLFCSEMVDRVADRAVQIHGGLGYVRGVTVERLYRDARLYRLYEGTSQIHQLIVGRSVLREFDPSNATSI